MKTRTYILILILVLAVLIVVGSCATKSVRTKSDEALYGTWVNSEYMGSTHPFGMEVYNSDGTWQSYRRGVSAYEEDIEVLDGGWIKAQFGSFTIEDKWVDADTNVWYKVVAYLGYEIDSHLAEGFYMLMKVGKSNNILEYMRSMIDYPVEIDTNNVQGRY